MNTTVSEIAHKMDYPVDAMLDISSVHVTGRETILIEGCKGLLEYSEFRITLDLGDYTVSIFGTNMRMENLSRISLSIKGKINSVSFDEKGRSL